MRDNAQPFSTGKRDEDVPQEVSNLKGQLRLFMTRVDDTQYPLQSAIRLHNGRDRISQVTSKYNRGDIIITDPYAYMSSDTRFFTWIYKGYSEVLQLQCCSDSS